MEKRLITLGCSFTEFSWPTWADWMGTVYPEYYNLGSGGSGNRFIFNKFTELINSGKLNKDTDIVIQWTSLLRDDLIPRGQTKYLGKGSVLHSGNYSLEYISEYFNPYQNIVETTNYIRTIKCILDSRRINYTMFFMLNPWDGTLLGEPWNTGDHPFSTHEKKKIDNALNELKKEIEGNFIEESLSMYQAEYQEDAYFCYQEKDRELQVEGHPAPKTHYNYFIHKILPYFPELQNILPNNTLSLHEWEVWAKLRMGENDKFTRKPKFPSAKSRII